MEEVDIKGVPLSFLFSTAAKLYYGAASEALKGSPVERYFFILVLLKKEGNLNQQELSDRVGVDKTAMVRIIDHLAEAKLVRRVQDPKDRRSFLIQLLPDAYELEAKVEETYNELNKRAFEGFKKKEKREFLAQLMLIQKNLSVLPKEHFELKYVKK